MKNGAVYHMPNYIVIKFSVTGGKRRSCFQRWGKRCHTRISKADLSIVALEVKRK